ncbi:hypothetical protein Q2T83_07765 [Fervidibacter sacchari]|uniref:Uncharacterized protein n=1 Tax=Candidatus Fervidibacter sacchari TaxID=1448929 RepID=A0ABT2EKQ9_9BACT|nr:hypothetical protein [Candidatus Fervidibacter sacchari]MCS3918530.1 hypothetical protein [Candidatus Fervidibacter sacchari]WKU17706.1 hypothetical protein Q2T83_07765 [Candidatus Fervidibacter sacchari]
MANSFSGGQCSCTAAINRHIRRCALQRLKLGGRSSCRAKTTANSDWRVANGFLEGILVHLPKVGGYEIKVG